MATKRLIFVYNVDASPVALLRDLYKGITTGQTDCHLCDVTYGHLLKDRSWKTFVEELPYAVRFHLRSTFIRNHPEFCDHIFPAAFVQIRGTSVLHELISADEINAVKNVAELRTLVSKRINKFAR